jgi:hypothetical protein
MSNKKNAVTGFVIAVTLLAGKGATAVETIVVSVTPQEQVPAPTQGTPTPGTVPKRKEQDPAMPPDPVKK